MRRLSIIFMIFSTSIMKIEDMCVQVFKLDEENNYIAIYFWGQPKRVEDPEVLMNSVDKSKCFKIEQLPREVYRGFYCVIFKAEKEVFAVTSIDGKEDFTDINILICSIINSLRYGVYLYYRKYENGDFDAISIAQEGGNVKWNI